MNSYSGRCPSQRLETVDLEAGRRLCEEVHLNLAYRWFYRHELDGRVPDPSTLSRSSHGRFLCGP